MRKQADIRGMEFEMLKNLGASQLPLRRYVKAEDVVEMVMFLSDQYLANNPFFQRKLNLLGGIIYYRSL